MKNAPLAFIFFTIISIIANASASNAKPYFEKTVLIKRMPSSSLKMAPVREFSSETQKIFDQIGAEKPVKMFPKALPPRNNNASDIRLIYRIRYTQDIDPKKLSEYLPQLQDIEYAQPEYKHQLCYTPNDPKLSLQYHHSVIQSYNAWDSIRSDSTIVIGIIDTGTDIDHEDLEGSIAYNYNDPINGEDDDNDGFTDNFRGWDLADNDNNPNIDVNDHGTWVSGLAAATADNGLGIAGSSFGAKFMPIKVATKYGNLSKTWEAIVYAADHGCDIINCSWGNNYYEPVGQDIVNYATLTKGALIVASAGNNSTQEMFYPASYRHVLSVAGTVESDEKWSVDNSQSSKGSSWGHFVDVSAPAAGYHSTMDGNSYAYIYGGTSFSAPIVSGLAALVKSKFPNLGPLAIAEQIKSQSDLIDTIPYNLPYSGMLGAGRINSYLATKVIDKPGIVFTNAQFSQQPPYLPGDTLTLTIEAANYLASATNITAKIQFNTKFITVLKETFSIPALATNDTANNASQHFRIVFSKELPLDFEAVAKITFSTKEYQSYDYLFIKTNPSSLNHTAGNIKTTITANGRIGYTALDRSGGIGLSFKDYGNIISDGGVAICEASNKMASSFLNKQDFSITEQAVTINPDSSDFRYRAQYFSDFLELQIDQTTEFWKDRDYMLSTYIITNLSKYDKPTVIFSNFYDWDIGTPYNNKTKYLEKNDISVSYSTEPNGLYTGTCFLSTDSSTIYVANNSGIGSDVVNLYEDKSDYIRYFCMTNNRREQTENILGTDIAVFQSTQPFSLKANENKKIIVATIFGKNEQDIQEVANRLKSTNNEPIQTTSVNKYQETSIIYPSICNDILHIKTEEPTAYTIKNLQGFAIERGYINSGIQNISIGDLPQAIYIIELRAINQKSEHLFIKR